jgi:hypothetical protein
MRRVHQLIIYFLLLAFFFFISCSSNPEQALVGRWQEVSGKETLEFLKDKIFTANMVWDMTKTSVKVSGTYSIEGDTVILRPDSPAGLVPITCKIKLTDANNELTVTFQQGGALKIDGSSSGYRRM